VTQTSARGPRSPIAAAIAATCAGRIAEALQNAAAPSRPRAT
jgi:hypothetical protein